VSQKRNFYTFVHNFGTYWRIFEILSLLNSSRNLQRSDDCYIVQSALILLVHYLVKWQLPQTFSYYNNAFNFSSHKQMSIYDEVQMTKFKCKLQRLFEIPSPLFARTHGTSWTLLVNRVVDDALVQTVPHVNQTLLQIVNVSQLRPINAVLYRTQRHLVVNRVEVTAVGRSQTSSSERQNLSLWVTQLSHEPYRPVGALSCWKMKKSPEIARISGSISCFSSTYVPIIRSIYFDARVNEYKVGK